MSALPKSNQAKTMQMLPSNILIADKICNAKRLTLSAVFNWEEINDALNQLKTQPLNEVCWEKPAVIPKVSFITAYHPQALIIKFYVEESSHQAIYQNANDPVFKDSCVEFFIAVDDSGNYYNFEFNSLGTCLASYGKNRHDRKKLDPELINTIKRKVNWIEKLASTQIYKWEITVILSTSIFCYDDIKCFNSTFYKANFYKCGDDLKPLHYLAWNKITSSNPDFHQPKYFGTLQLV